MFLRHKQKHSNRLLTKNILWDVLIDQRILFSVDTKNTDEATHFDPDFFRI